MRKRNMLVAWVMVMIMGVLSACSSSTPPASSPGSSGSDSQPAAPAAEQPAASEPAASSEKYVIKVATQMQTAEAFYQGMEKVAARLKERSGGRLELQLFPGNQIGAHRETYQQMLSGAPVIGVTDPGYMADYVPDIAILQGPFLVKDYAELRKLLESAWWAGLEEQLAQKGLQVLTFNWYFGERHLIAGKPILSPADMKGLKVRTPPSKMWIETISAMGGTPTPLEWGEVYSGLAQGVADAAEAPLASLFNSKLHEVKKTVSLTAHFKAIAGWVIGKSYFDSLPEDLRQMLLEEFRNIGPEVSQMILDGDAEWRKKMEDAGVTFVEADVAAFQQATESVYTKFDWTPGLFEQVKQIRDN